ncbi:hypothetical protein [Scytonema sp. PCC 10023]|uniref:hypothetical protein n=1 Tax=Scytonema sp. PCC 10023 TaxID=1680591 RepID=UPI0039C70447
MVEANSKQGATTLNQFRKPLTRGADYTIGIKPKLEQLTVSATGKTDKEAELHIANCRRIGNEWDMVGAEFDVQTKMHNAHQKMFGAATAQINASTSYINGLSAWNKNQVAISNERISANEARVAIASVPVEIQRQNVELEKKKENLIKSRIELESLLMTNSQAREDLSHDKMMARLDGYKIEVKLPELITQNISGLLDHEPKGNL